MQETIEKTKKDIETILQNEEEHQDKKIEFILINPTTNETLTIASNGNDSMIYFTPYTIDEKNKYVSVADWDFSFDQYFFQDLQNGYQIGYITNETHYNLWNALQEYYPEDIEYKDGVQLYLQYCADIGITKEYLDEKTNLDTPNIMDFFKGLALHETMTYKGYVIEADDTNYDNPKENIVNIYKSQEDFNENKISESVSLNTINLKQNIKEYIDDFYIDKADFESEKEYITFVLDCDLLNDMIKKYKCIEGMSHPNMGRMFKKGQVYKLTKSKDNEVTLGGWNIDKKYLDTNFELVENENSDILYEQEKILNIKFIGIDNWDRPVYKDKDGIIYKDINLGNGVLALTTSVNNDFYGEPECSIKDIVKINIVQKLENEQQRSSHEQDR